MQANVTHAASNSSSSNSSTVETAAEQQLLLAVYLYTVRCWWSSYRGSCSYWIGASVFVSDCLSSISPISLLATKMVIDNKYLKNKNKNKIKCYNKKCTHVPGYVYLYVCVCSCLAVSIWGAN